MKIKDLVELLDGEVITEDCNYDEDISYGFSADLMSDALMLLRNSPLKEEEQGILITGLVTNQAIRTAEMLDINYILFVRGKEPSANVIDLAEDSDITLITTKKTMFVSNGLLYQNNVVGIL